MRFQWRLLFVTSVSHIICCYISTYYMTLYLLLLNDLLFSLSFHSDISFYLSFSSHSPLSLSSFHSLAYTSIYYLHVYIDNTTCSYFFHCNNPEFLPLSLSNSALFFLRSFLSRFVFCLLIYA